MLALAGHTVAAQSLDEPTAKAAFLLNFARFTEWPAPEAHAVALTICAVDRDVALALATTVTGRTAGDRPVQSRRLAQADGPDGCDVLFFGGLDRRQVSRLLQTTARRPVLTVGDQDGFALSGGAIELFIEDGRMGFLINRTAAEQAGLRLSSRLLGLARLVGH